MISLRSLFLSSFLATSAFSACNNTGTYSNWTDLSYSQGADCAYEMSIKYSYTSSGTCYMKIYTSCNKTASNTWTYTYKRGSLVSSCPSGTFRDVSGACIPGDCSGNFDYNNFTCFPPPYSAYDNDQQGCEANGYYYFNDGTCTDGTGAIAKIFQDPLAVSGSFLMVNGFAWTAAGLLLGATPLGAAGALTWGTYATLAGVGSIALSAADQLYVSSDSPSPTNDVTLDDGTRLKVSMDQYDNTQISKVDTTTGKVESISTIPPEVRQRIIDGNVNPTTGEPYNSLSPADFAGTKSTTFDYASNTATTQTVQSDGSIKTETTKITTVSNSDGSVTTLSSNPIVAPTVTGTTGSTIQVPEWNQYQTIASWTETVADDPSPGSTTTGTVSTGGGSTGGGVIGTDAETGEDLFGSLSLDDGSSRFDDLTNQVGDAFDDYEYPDPLRISCSNTLSIDPIYFDLMGRRFTLLDNQMLSYIDAELVRSILLFVAAVSAVMLTFLGGI